MTTFRSLHLIIAGLLAVLTVTPTFAVAPTTDTSEVIITDNVLASCEGFDIIENAVTTFRGTTFYDRNGTPIRIQLHVKYTGTLANSETGTSVVDGPDAHTFMLDLRTGLVHHVGLVWSINIAGEGIVVLEAGSLVGYDDGEVVAVHGPHQILEGGLEVLCNVLD